ncbi:unnamed protein product, partial [Symbiodinium microadriaticum]
AIAACAKGNAWTFSLGLLWKLNEAPPLRATATLLNQLPVWVAATLATWLVCWLVVSPVSCHEVPACTRHLKTYPGSWHVISCAMLLTMVMYEVMSLIATYMGAQHTQSLIPHLKSKCLPTFLLALMFGVLASAERLFSRADWTVAHVMPSPDGLTPVGRPVYTLQYMEWGINVPILLILAGYCSMGRPLQEISRPLVVTNIYVILCWAATATESAVLKWLLIVVSFAMYGWASYDMLGWCVAFERSAPMDLPARSIRPMLSSGLVLHLLLYGVVYVASTVGFISAHLERKSFFALTFGSKLAYSAAFVFIRADEYHKTLTDVLRKVSVSNVAMVSILRGSFDIILPCVLDAGGRCKLPSTHSGDMTKLAAPQYKAPCCGFGVEWIPGLVGLGVRDDHGGAGESAVAFDKATRPPDEGVSGLVFLHIPPSTPTPMRGTTASGADFLYTAPDTMSPTLHRNIDRWPPSRNWFRALPRRQRGYRLEWEFLWQGWEARKRKGAAYDILVAAPGTDASKQAFLTNGYLLASRRDDFTRARRPHAEILNIFAKTVGDREFATTAAADELLTTDRASETEPVRCGESVRTAGAECAPEKVLGCPIAGANLKDLLAGDQDRADFSSYVRNVVRQADCPQSFNEAMLSTQGSWTCKADAMPPIAQVLHSKMQCKVASGTRLDATIHLSVVPRSALSFGKERQLVAAIQFTTPTMNEAKETDVGVVGFESFQAKKSVSSGGSTQPTSDTRSNSGIVANLADLNKLGMPGMLESSEEKTNEDSASHYYGASMTDETMSHLAAFTKQDNFGRFSQAAFDARVVGVWEGTVNKALGGYRQRIEFSHDCIHANITVMGKTLEACFRMDCSKDPCHLDIEVIPAGSSCPPPAIPYIFKFEGDCLVLCGPGTSSEAEWQSGLV